MEYNHYEYVKKYFALKYCTYFNNFSEKQKKKLCMEISQKVRKKFNNLRDVLDGKADDFIMSIINGTVNIVRPQLRINYLNLRNSVTKIITANYIVNCDKKTLDTLVEQVCADLMSTYTEAMMNAGEMDDLILKFYKIHLKMLCKEIRKYVTDYVSMNVTPIADVDNVAVENEIIELVLNTNTINAFDLLLGRCNNKILQVAEKNREINRNKRLAENPDTFKYIMQLIEVYGEDDIKTVNQNVRKVDNKLRDEGLTPSEIVSGKYNYTIRKLYNEYKMKSMYLYIYNNSVKREDVPEQIEPVRGKVDMSLVMKKVLVTATLIGFTVVGGYKFGQDIKTNFYENEVDRFDTYSYGMVNSIYSDRFEMTANNIINEFDKYNETAKKFGDDNYSYLSFYKAYKSVSQENLYVMDNMLSEIKDDIKDKDEHSELYNNIKNDRCYLNFIYDRLESMGFEEIKEEKYIELLSAYMKATYDHRYSNPMDYLTREHKKLLTKVLDKYEDYSEQCLVQFGVLLHNENNVQDIEVVNRRGH